MRSLHYIFLTLIMAGCQPLMEIRNPDIITAVGYAGISEQRGQTIEEKRLKAMRASKVDAYRELAEQVYGLRISGSVELYDQQLSSESTDGSVDGSIRGAEVVRSYPVGDSFVTEMQLDLKKMERIGKMGEVYTVPTRQETLF